MKALSLLILLVACSGPVTPSPPVFVAGPVVVGISARQATISWATDVPTTGSVTLTPEEGGDIISVEISEALVAHDLVLQNLPPQTSFTVRVVAQAEGLIAEAERFSFSTLRDTSEQKFRVLFDAAHGQDAGNADWVIDDGERFPSPENPSREDDWDGAISNWGFDLFQSGRYEIESLPEGERFTFGDATNPQDLSLYEALIIPEPNRHFSAEERSAVIDFVEQGGGLVLVANHDGADRDNDGVDAIDALNRLMNENGHQNDVFGVQFDRFVDITADPATNLVVQQGLPVIDGPFGVVQVIAFNNGTTMTLTPGGPATPLIWDNGAPQTNTRVLVAVSSFGAGKVVLVGDSSPFDDGTARPGNDNIFDSWNASGQDNDILFLNAVAFVVGDGG